MDSNFIFICFLLTDPFKISNSNFFISAFLNQFHQFNCNSMKKRMNSQKQLCLKQNCCGAKNKQQNYLQSINRHQQSTSRIKKSPVKKTISTKKLQTQMKKGEEVNKLLQESYNEAKQENARLIKKLNIKKKKVQELQQKVKQLQTSQENYTLQIEHFQSLLKAYEQRKSGDDATQRNMKGQKYQTIIEAQQSLTRGTLEKYKALERVEMEKRLEEGERVNKKLERESLQMRSKLETERGKLQQERSKLLIEKKYESEIESLRRELSQVKSSSQQKSAKESKQSHTISLERELTQLRQKNHLLEEQLLCVSSKLKQTEHEFNLRQQQLLSNLDKINEKVRKFEKQTKKQGSIKSNEVEEWKQKYEQVVVKYQQKKEKYFSKNEEWAEIFKELMMEIDKLKKEVAYISERNIKLVELYVEGETKDV